MIAITGATGRVGLRLVDALKKRKEKFVCIVRSKESAKKLPSGVKWRLASLETGAGLPEALADATHVVDLAGSTDTRLSAEQLMVANATSTSHVFTAIPKSVKRVVHISSIAVYGKPSHSMRFNEHDHPRPDTPYAKSKFAGEKIARIHASRFPVTILRPSIVYGPGFEEGFFPVLKNIDDGKMRLIGDGENHIPLVHVDDLVEAILLALNSKKSGVAIYNISSPPEKSYSQKRLFSIAADLLCTAAPEIRSHLGLTKFAIGARSSLLSLFGKKTSLTPDMIDQLACDRIFDTTLAEKELGFAPKIDLKDGIRQTITEYRKWKNGKNSRLHN